MWDEPTQELMTPNDSDLARAHAFTIGVATGDTDALDLVAYQAAQDGRLPQLQIATAELLCRAASLRENEDALADFRIACARHTNRAENGESK